MTISTVSSDDFPQWEGLFRQYIAFYKTSLPDEQYKNTFDRIVAQEGDLHALVVREGDGNIKGLAHFLFHTESWSNKPICYLNDLFVSPEVRGRGYGRRLIIAVGKIAEEKGCGRYYWMTQHGNAAARRLYDTFGTSEFTEYQIQLPAEKW